MADRRARFLHANGAEVQRLSRSAGVLKIPVARARVAAGEINDAKGNLIFHQGANETHLGSIVVLVPTKHQHRFRKRIDTEFQHIRGNHSPGGVQYFYPGVEKSVRPWRELKLHFLRQLGAVRIQIGSLRYHFVRQFLSVRAQHPGSHRDLAPGGFRRIGQ